MVLGESLMKIVVKVRDAVELARRFETSPREALREVVEHVRDGVRQSLEEVMDAEIGVFLGQPAERANFVFLEIVRIDSRATWCRATDTTRRLSSETWRCFTLPVCRRGCSRT